MVKREARAAHVTNVAQMGWNKKQRMDGENYNYFTE
jgi:hypothetical protein